jgi:glycosyltransferase involved in cell wall biosynthesis
MKPLLSIVIPTRNRQKYCIAAIKDILSYDYELLQLCVHDNSDDDQIEKYISNVNADSRLVYKRIPQQIASIFNINESISLATGKYVLLIGDDDTVLPEIFNVVEWANREGFDSICPSVNVEYFWPGVVQDSVAGVLIIPEYTKKTWFINVENSLRELFINGVVNYQGYMLPKVYHGIVLREKLKEVECLTGNYFNGLSPDISGVVSLSSVVKNHVIIDYPITVAGVCPKSTSSQGLNKLHCGELDSAPHLHLRGDYKWDEMVPKYYSVETIWAESALNTAKVMGLDYLYESFNFYRLAAFALLRNPSIFKYALTITLRDKTNPKNTNLGLTLILIFNYCVYFVVRKAFRLLKNVAKRKHHRLQVIGGISEAVKVFNEKNNLCTSR